VFLQKKCAELPGFRDRTGTVSLRFVEALTTLDPMLAVWIARLFVRVRPAPVRGSVQ